VTDSPGKEGLAARARALQLYELVTQKGLQLDEALSTRRGSADLNSRDAALAHAIVAAALRHHGQLSHLLAGLLSKPLPRSAGISQGILLLGLAQLLVLRSNAPAAVNLSVELAKQDKNARHFAALINAVLRQALRQQPVLGDPQKNMPPWLLQRLQATYGAEVAGSIAEAHLHEAGLDLTPKQDGAAWAQLLGGSLLPTGTIRLLGEERNVADLPGFADGAWWVQDAAAALPVALLGSQLSGRSALDLCAAPGGKTAQLASLGARVTAVDISKPRMQRLQENMRRLNLDVEIKVADIRGLPDDQSYGIVLLDAPCSATGTMRRHPDLALLKSASQIEKLAGVQRELLVRAARLVEPGGSLVYCVCSLLPEEGEEQARQFLANTDGFSLRPAEAGLVGTQPQFISPEGFLRTLPSMPIGPHKGLDGFFAAHFVRH
jgi:16S rRNA (cytosine967-C5)-methyltransferase